MKEKNNKETIDFLLDDQDFTNSIKKIRRKTILKNSLFTSMLLIIVFAFLYMGSMKILNYRIDSRSATESRWILLTNPNVQQGSADYTYNLFSANGELSYTKRFGDRIIPWQTKRSSYTLINSTISFNNTIEQYSEDEKQWLVFNAYNGQRELQFHHPSVDYKQLPQALQLLSRLDKNTYYEFAISFDRAYPFQEIEHMLPRENTEWLWVDTQAKSDIQRKQEADQAGELSSFMTGSIFGFPYNRQFDWPSPEFFLSQLQHEEIQSSPIANRATEIYQMLEQYNDDEIPIIGAVITGTPEELLKYLDMDFIRASSLGASVRKY